MYDVWGDERVKEGDMLWQYTWHICIIWREMPTRGSYLAEMLDSNRLPYKWQLVILTRGNNLAGEMPHRPTDDRRTITVPSPITPSPPPCMQHALHPAPAPCCTCTYLHHGDPTELIPTIPYDTEAPLSLSCP